MSAISVFRSPGARRDPDRGPHVYRRQAIQQTSDWRNPSFCFIFYLLYIHNTLVDGQQTVSKGDVWVRCHPPPTDMTTVSSLQPELATCQHDWRAPSLHR